jgi:hypothetical protein
LATSGNTTWELTRNELIEASLRTLGVLSEGQTANATQLSTGAEALNGVIALFQTKGMPLWKRTEQVVIPVLSQQAYTITDAVKVPQVVLRFTNAATQYELIEKSMYDFNRLPTNTSANAGTPVHYYFQPGIQDGMLNIWPVPDAGTVANNTFVVVKQKKFDGFFAAGETPDFPSYYNLALIYQTAVVLAPQYGIPLQDRQSLRSEAKEYTDEAFSYGDEDGSFYIQPDMQMMRGW